ncbi:tyrosine-protein kinase STYK1-like [Oryzias melastigma]|uniref:tyrosine-protein kinase STYK1-like n=1 Tax=Oryzias melastigma TaxID=30732 RepID=UPI00168CF113|nr:tyrosine-protein kinase STYK1-like [Oryzias melastigma]
MAGTLQPGPHLVPCPEPVLIHIRKCCDSMDYLCSDKLLCEGRKPQAVRFSIKPNETVSYFRARMDNRNVVLRVLKENPSNSEKQDFMGFASFLSSLGPHPFIPALLGVVSMQSPLVLVVEELKHRDLLGFLWSCRQEYLHSRRCIHGNVGACSVLVGADMTAKLWGLGPAYRRRTSTTAVEEVGMKKWQAPEVLARSGLSQSSDM